MQRLNKSSLIIPHSGLTASWTATIEEDNILLSLYRMFHLKLSPNYQSFVSFCDINLKRQKSCV
jgi:hypothetical protein